MTGGETDEEDRVLSFSHTLQQKSIRLLTKASKHSQQFVICILKQTVHHFHKLTEVSFLCYADFYTFFVCFVTVVVRGITACFQLHYAIQGTLQPNESVL